MRVTVFLPLNRVTNFGGLFFQVYKISSSVRSIKTFQTLKDIFGLLIRMAEIPFSEHQLKLIIDFLTTSKQILRTLVCSPILVERLYEIYSSLKR